MIKFQRILFPVDFSARTAAVVPSIQAMIKRFGFELTVLHVVDLPPSGIAPPEAAAWATLIGADRLREQGKIALDRFIAREFPGIDGKAGIGRGRSRNVIVDYARDSGADLIMMPTSGLGRFRRLLLGSVTAKVLHDTSVPVWTGVHAEEIAAHPPDRWKQMLCALDDDPRDLPVLEWAAEFASEQKLELRLVHAVRARRNAKTIRASGSFSSMSRANGSDKLQAHAGTNFEVCLKAGQPQDASFIKQPSATPPTSS